MNTQKTHYTTKFDSHYHSIILCCNGISSPANMGSIFRLSDAFGVEKILLDVEELDLKSARLRRTARSTEKSIPFEINVDIQKNIKALAQNNYEIIALEITDQSNSLHKAVFENNKIALVLGNEAFGIASNLLPLCHKHIHINMFGKNSSMNVAQAAGITLYEITKQLKAS